MTVEEILSLCQPHERRLVVGFVSHHRYDLLTQAIEAVLAGSRQPNRFVVIDNGRGYDSPFGSAVEVIRPPFNLGYAGGINAINDLEPDAETIIMNDDMLVGRRTIEQTAETPGWFVSAHAFGCFLMRPLVREVVGPWEAAYWPIGPEDQDYNWRLVLACRNPVQMLDPPLPDPLCRIIPGALCSRVDPECIHVHGGQQTGATMGEWALGLRGRANSLVERRWGPRTQWTDHYAFTYAKLYDGNPTDEVALFVREGIACGALPPQERMQAAFNGVTRVAQLPSVSPYWAAACTWYAPTAELIVARPLDRSWPAAWGLAQDRLKAVILESPSELTESVDLLIDEGGGSAWYPLASRIINTRGEQL